jgi:hypothetical protein
MTTSKSKKMTARAKLHAVLAAPAMGHLKCLSQASCDVQELRQPREPSVPTILQRSHYFAKDRRAATLALSAADARCPRLQ